MSTELLEVKGISDDIFDQAGMPKDADEHYYTRTQQIIEAMIKAMDEAGLTHDEQRRRIGAKKDELIGELRRHISEGIIRTGDPGQPIKKIVMQMNRINVKRAH